MSDGNYLALIAEARDALIAKDEQIGKLSTIVAKLSTALAEKDSHAELGAAIVQAGRWFDVTEAAKELAVEITPGKRIGQNQLYAFLRNTGMLMRRRDPVSGWWYHQPKQDQVDAGRMKLQERPDFSRDVVYRKALISPSGLIYISRKIAEAAAAGVLDELVGE